MKYKITALKDASILIRVPTKIKENLGGGEFAWRDGEKIAWVHLKAGETKDGLGMLAGADPRFVPKGIPTVRDGFRFVPSEPWLVGDLPKEFWGLIRLEVSQTSE